jgi:hypothetical protein
MESTRGQTEPTMGKLRIGLKALIVRDRQIDEIRGYMRSDLVGRFDDAGVGWREAVGT